MNIMFMGTPDFASVSLRGLINSGFNVTCAVCQPDKPVGRKQVMTPPDVKITAQELGITNIYQPSTLKDGSFADVLEKERPDLIVVVAYGKILPKYVLDFPKYGCINLHGSILPKYRGSAPIQWSVINGDSNAGVTTMYMSEGLDCGDIIDIAKTPIGENETAGELFDRLAKIGSTLLCETIIKIKDGTATRTPQNNDEASLAPMLSKETGRISFEKTAREIHNLVRGLNPWPLAYIETSKGTLKIYESEIINKNSGKPAGSIIESSDSLCVQTGDKIISFKTVQLQGKKAMSACDLLRGNKIELI